MRNSRSASPTGRWRPGETALVFHPPVLALGIGCERGCAPEEIAALAARGLAEAGLAAWRRRCGRLGRSQDRRARHPCARRALGVPARFFSSDRAARPRPRASPSHPRRCSARPAAGASPRARRLAAAGQAARSCVPKRKSRRATCAIARAATPLDAGTIGRPRGRLAIVGIGPGDAAWRTPEASALVSDASDIVGYRLYLDLLGRAIAGKTRPRQRDRRRGGARAARARSRRRGQATSRSSRRAMPGSTAWRRWSSS